HGLNAAELLQPAQQLAVAAAAGGKRLIRQASTVRIEGNGVMRLEVAIDTTDDECLRSGHTDCVVSCAWGRPGRQRTDRAVMGPLTRSYQVTFRCHRAGAVN